LLSIALLSDGGKLSLKKSRLTPSSWAPAACDKAVFDAAREPIKEAYILRAPE
jgi:hypothetical protein